VGVVGGVHGVVLVGGEADGDKHDWNSGIIKNAGILE
jgi:hypothetical protein